MSHLASKMEFVHPGEVKTTIEKKVTTAVQKTDWTKKMKVLEEKFAEAGESDTEFWTAAMLNDMDDAAQEAFGEMKGSIATRDEGYENAMGLYMRDLLTIVETHQKHHPLTQSVLGRIRWAFTDHPNRPNADCPFIPLMTEFVFVMLNEALNAVGDGIDEVSNCRAAEIVRLRFPAYRDDAEIVPVRFPENNSALILISHQMARWVEPLWGNPVSPSGCDRWTDATDTIVRALKFDRKIEDADGAIAQVRTFMFAVIRISMTVANPQIFNMILEHRKTFLYDLHIQLSSHGALLKREAKATDLAPYFATKEPKNKAGKLKGKDEVAKFDFLKKTKDREAKLATIVKHMESKAENEVVPRSEHVSEWTLLLASSCPWKGVDKKTRKAKYREIARVLMVETERLKRYRPKLATKTSAARFRHMIEEQMSNFAVSQKKDKKQMKEWVLWDHRDVDLEHIRMPKALSLEEEQNAENERTTMKEQLQDIEKIIKTVSNAPVAKANEGRAGVAGQVHQALLALVEVRDLKVSNS
jgi:hypothetical protein